MNDKAEFHLHRFIPYVLTITAEASSLSFTRIYRSKFNMLRNDWRVMVHLGTFGSLSAKDIGEKSGLHKTKISRAVARMSERRWLEKNVPSHDRRFEVLSLTTQGNAVYQELCREALAHNSALTKHLTDSEVETLFKLLGKLALDNYIPRP